MPKVISDHFGNVKLYINLGPCSLRNQLECKQLVLEVLSFHMFISTWVKHQIVDINIQDLS